MTTPASSTRRNRRVSDALSAAEPPQTDSPAAEVEPQNEDQARAERVATIKAWSAAQRTRRAFLHHMLTGSEPPPAAAAYLATELAIAGPELRQYLAGPDPLFVPVAGFHSRKRILNAAATMTAGRALAAALAIVLSAQEEALTRTNWRTATEASTRYLTFLAHCGHQLAPIEQSLVLPSSPPAPTGGDTTSETSV